MNAARNHARDLRYAACVVGLGLLGVQAVLPPVVDALVTFFALGLSVWCWPWKESPGTFGVVAGPTILLALVAMIVLGPLVRAGQTRAVEALHGVALVGPLLWACAMAWIVWLWTTRRAAVD